MVYKKINMITLLPFQMKNIVSRQITLQMKELNRNIINKYMNSSTEQSQRITEIVYSDEHMNKRGGQQFRNKWGNF